MWNTKLQYDETGPINHSLEMLLSFMNKIINYTLYNVRSDDNAI